MATTYGINDLAHLPPSLISAAAYDAEHAADLVGNFIRETGLRKMGAGGRLEPLTLPAAFLIEMAAVLQLREWEQQGLFEHLGPGVLSSREAIEHLGVMFNEGPDRLDDLSRIPLTLHVVRVSMERLAWEGPSVLGANVALAPTTDDDLIGVLAEFMWHHRHAQFNEVSE